MVGKAVQDVLKFDAPFLTCNAAATSCMELYTFVVPNHHHIHWHEHTERSPITPHTVPFFAFHFCLAENGVLIAKTKMSYRDCTPRIP